MFAKHALACVCPWYCRSRWKGPKPWQKLGHVEQLLYSLQACDRLEDTLYRTLLLFQGYHIFLQHYLNLAQMLNGGVFEGTTAGLHLIELHTLVFSTPAAAKMYARSCLKATFASNKLQLPCNLQSTDEECCCC